MSVSTLSEVTYQIQKYWSFLFMKELRESLLLGSLVNKDYDGEIRQGGDTVTVSQYNAPTGELLTVGTNADSFTSQPISMSKVQITADKRAVASYKVQDLVDLQSQVNKNDSEMMNALKFAVAQQINTYLYSLVSPSTSAPDHDIASVTDLNASQVGAVRVLAAQAKWLQDGRWYGLLSPQYYQDIMNASTFASSDYVGADQPTVSGQVALRRFGFQLLEDNSRTGDYGLFFHPDFMHLVMQTQPSIKVSDLHPLGQFGYLISVDCVFGAKLGINGNVKHIKVYG